jgi:hypothetical protein
VEKRIEPPLVLKEIDDLELMYFESVDDVLSDRFDILWGETFAGWDSRGLYFRVERRYPAERWWHRLWNVDRSYLELVSVEASPIDIQRVLEKELNIVYSSRSQQRLSIAQLIRLGLDRELKLANQTYRIRW